MIDPRNIPRECVDSSDWIGEYVRLKNGTYIVRLEKNISSFWPSAECDDV